MKETTGLQEGCGMLIGESASLPFFEGPTFEVNWLG